ncbi:TRAF3-interacting protein 1-like [Hippocampus zosterae]|uniref:TRAF3-interacting protein 1-like n=1 Tax=Hippocampus zosterae TaxID=109293 RepID=UPI00223CFB3B|nr:TRAF3-interacting protein 1-like [Hippocampus zosterae]
MAAVNSLVIKKTQSTLGKVIKKPALTDKLLSKPPFRYLHDIFTEIIRTTGFLKGLYKDNELKSECIKDKEMKMAFLQKAIDVVVLVTGEPLAVRPAHIVAGHEPEKTNELLQAIAKCCLSKMSSKEAVKRVLAGERLDVRAKDSAVKSQDKDAAEGRQAQPDREKKTTTEQSDSGAEKAPEPLREQDKHRRDGEREQRPDREPSAKNHRREQDFARDGEQEDKSRQRQRDKANEDAALSGEREREKEKSQAKESGKPREKERDKSRSSESERRKTSSSRTESPPRTSQPSSAKGPRRKNTLGDESNSEVGDTRQDASPPNKESGDAADCSLSSDVASSNNRPARPSSARPAPPRVKKQESSAEALAPDRLSSGKSAVIREGKKRSDDEEDEQFLVAEAAHDPADQVADHVPPPSATPKGDFVVVVVCVSHPVSFLSQESAQDFRSEEKHGRWFSVFRFSIRLSCLMRVSIYAGGLVKKILETKKDYEPSPNSNKSKESASEEARKKEQDQVTREIERLRASIQSVCQSALPLGKIMDYVQEDIDAMRAELHGWRRENKEHAQELMREQKVTDQAVEPLKAELGELDQQMKDYRDKICAVRSNILTNEENIQKKLAAIISSRS